MTDQLFSMTAEGRQFGQTYNGRYHMPLLPGEDGPKSGGDHVPYGLTRMTNLVGAFEDTRALSIWEQAMGLIGLALAPELYEELCLIVHAARDAGTNFELLREYPDLREVLAGAPHHEQKQAASIIGRAKSTARANAAAQRGNNRHTAWEHRGKTDGLIGTPDVQSATLGTERLLQEAGLVRMPGMAERVVRNVALGAVGKFDDVLMELSTGRMLMADLKTKATAFYSWMTVDAQLAGYARAEWMLTEDRTGYEPGPMRYVDQTEGVILHVPSDGGPARLERADLVQGWQTCVLAKQVIEHRAAGKSADRHSRSAWTGNQTAS